MLTMIFTQMDIMLSRIWNLLRIIQIISQMVTIKDKVAMALLVMEQVKKKLFRFKNSNKECIVCSRVQKGIIKVMDSIKWEMDIIYLRFKTRYINPISELPVKVVHEITNTVVISHPALYLMSLPNMLWPRKVSTQRTWSKGKLSNLIILYRPFEEFLKECSGNQKLAQMRYDYKEAERQGMLQDIENRKKFIAMDMGGHH